MAVGVHGHAHQPARQLPAQPLADRDVGGVRPAEPHRDAEPLGGADRDVGAQLPRRREQGQREQVSGDRDRRPPGAGGGDDRPRVGDLAAGRGVGQQDAEQLPVRLGRHQLRGEGGHDQLDAERLGAGGQHRQRLRQAVLVGQEDAALTRLPARERHRLGGGAGLVQQGRARHRQPGQVGDHRLEVQQGLQPPLRDLRLVGRVGRVPGGVLQHVAADHGRGDGRVVAQPDHGRRRRVPVGQPAQPCLRLRLRQRPGQAGQVQRGGAGAAQRRRQRGRGQRVQGGVADGGEHLLLLVRGRPDVACGEVHGASRGEPPGARAPGSGSSPSVIAPRRWGTTTPEMPVPSGP